MCPAPAVRSYFIEGEGFLEVCNRCYKHLEQIRELRDEFKISLKKIIHDLNQDYVKIPMTQAPTKMAYNRGWKYGLHTAIHKIEDVLEELIK